MKASVNKSAVQAPAKRRAVGVRAVHTMHGPDTPSNILSNARHRLQEEIVMEGLLHVTAAQAGSCLERFGDMDSVSAPLVEPLTAALTDMSSSNNIVVSEAICLATPPDPTETENNRPVIRHAARPSSGSESSVTGAIRAGTVLQEGAGELLQLEAQACQRTVLFNIYTAEVLQASAQVRRQRRRAFVKALRASKETARGLLQAPGATLAAALASLGSNALSGEQ